MSLAELGVALVLLAALGLPWAYWLGPGGRHAPVPQSPFYHLASISLQALLFSAGLMGLHKWVQAAHSGAFRLGLLVLAFAMQFLSYQKAILEKEGSKAALALRCAQTGWIGLALGLEGPGPAIGALNLVLQQFVLTLPLMLLLFHERSGQRNLFALLALALAGCIPFSAFSAYFQVFIPLMGSSSGVHSMHEKLFTGQALVGTIAIFSVLYQTSALGMLAWNRMKQETAEQPLPPGLRIFGWTCLATSLVMGLQANWVAGYLARLIEAMGVKDLGI